MGHELPPWSIAGAAVMPLITDTKADDCRGREGPISAARTRSKSSELTTLKPVTDLPTGA